MARFARDCIVSMNDLTKKLEMQLGPDTTDLGMRVGLHSGPVTAGVLRGDKSRFQLFGDTMNTAARMEALGVKNRIHISRETAELLKIGGKAHWIVPRSDPVEAKGKGLLHTFFLDIKKQSSGSQTSAKSANSSECDIVYTPHLQSDSNKAETGSSLDHLDPQLRRIVEWNSDILLRFLRQIVARRNAVEKYRMDGSTKQSLTSEYACDGGDSSGRHKTVLDEAKEIIVLPEFNAKVVQNEEDPRGVVLPTEVVRQTKEFVAVVASLYHTDNPFHNVSPFCAACES
jgi:Adenylate and Guanylate cyclase catalytic domain